MERRFLFSTTHTGINSSLCRSVCLAEQVDLWETRTALAEDEDEIRALAVMGYVVRGFECSRLLRAYVAAQRPINGVVTKVKRSVPCLPVDKKKEAKACGTP